MLGINVPRFYAWIVVIGFFLAGLAGGLLLPNQTLSPSLASVFVVQAFGVLIVGGMGNIRGAFLASILLCVVNSYGSVLFPQVPGIFFYVAMAVMLLARPQGSDRGSTPMMSRTSGSNWRRDALIARRCPGGPRVAPLRRQQGHRVRCRHPRAARSVRAELEPDVRADRPCQLRPCVVLRHRRLCIRVDRQDRFRNCIRCCSSPERGCSVRSWHSSWGSSRSADPWACISPS